MKSNEIILADLQLFIWQIGFYMINDLHKRKLNVPLQPAKEVEKKLETIAKHQTIKIKNIFWKSKKGSYLCNPKSKGSPPKAIFGRKQKMKHLAV